MNRVVAVDIGGTKLAAAAIDVHGRPVSLRRQPTPAQAGPAAILDAVAEMVAEAAGGDRIDAVGVATAGTVDVARGTIVGATDSLADWRGTDVAGGLAARLAVPRDRIHVENDVQAHALGEATFRAHAPTQTMVFIAVGTGVGGGLVEHGIVRRGARHAAGAVGHIPVPAAAGLRCGCGALGHLEAVASGTGMHAAWLAAGGDPGVRGAREVVTLAEAGDPRAVGAVTRSGTGLGEAIAGIVATIDTDLVVIGGGLAAAGELWWRAVTRTLHAELLEELRETRVERSALGWSAALAGAGISATRLLGTGR